MNCIICGGYKNIQYGNGLGHKSLDIEQAFCSRVCYDKYKNDIKDKLYSGEFERIITELRDKMDAMESVINRQQTIIRRLNKHIESVDNQQT